MVHRNRKEDENTAPDEYHKYIIAANLDGEAVDTWLEIDRPNMSYIELRDRFFVSWFPDSLQGDEPVIPPDRDFKRALYSRIPQNLRLLLREKASDSYTTYKSFRTTVREEYLRSAINDLKETRPLPIAYLDPSRKRDVTAATHRDGQTILMSELWQ
eukprot:GHVO01056730.1.p1 GENE.GHVO01056730.1~~GHVO01056730.1.p1  ORF type:complete len:157 (-),score=6.38 GHVO01056730.1:202-672(-)